MYPVLIDFDFPLFLGRLTWIEVGITALAIGLLALWRISIGKFAWQGFAIWTGAYLLLRGIVWHAGPGYHFELHTYGVLIALAFVSGIYLAVRQARREFIPADFILDLSFWILIAAMVGSRVAFIAVNWRLYLADPFLILKIWQGGLVFYGGFIGAVWMSWTYCKKANMDFFRIADVMIPSVALGHFFGRLGCFSAGCCHGAPTGIDWYGAVYTAKSTVVYKSDLLGVPLHPTQLYDALAELSIFFLLVLWRRRKRFNGQLLALWLILYPPFRTLNEMFRADVERGVGLTVDINGVKVALFTFSQMISLGLICLGIFLWFWLSRRTRKNSSG